MSLKVIPTVQQLQVNNRFFTNGYFNNYGFLSGVAKRIKKHLGIDLK